MLKKILGIVFIFVSTISMSQTWAWFETNDHVEKDWQVGIGTDVVRFSNDDAEILGDQHLIQMPRVNVAKEISDYFIVDGAFSVGTFDGVLIENQFTYFGFDVSGRYKYYNKLESLDPYIFAGLSYVDFKDIAGPTINLGTGVTYWVSRNIGLNAQVLYKNALNRQEMASHAQFCGGIVFGFSSNKRINTSRCSFNR